VSAGGAPSVVIVGCGIFGLSAALELRRRGFSVDVVDRDRVPAPAASSTDVSKAVRMDYGADEFYAELAERALDGWRAWNRRWDRPRFHEVGILLLARRSMDEGGFEHDSFETMRRRGVPVERLGRERLAERFPAWAGSPYPDGYFNPRAGWAESGAVVASLAVEARAAGVVFHEEVSDPRLIERGSQVAGLAIAGEPLEAPCVIVTAGAWTPGLVPAAAAFVRAVGQPVLLLEPPDPSPFAGERFPVWCADIANTGWYGFPVTADGALKIGNHGPGRSHAAGAPLAVGPDERERCLRFARETFSSLAGGAPVRASRLCLYADTPDGDFLIDHVPGRSGLVVATGGSGHAFKFAPLLGGIIADVVERRPGLVASRFAWRRPRAGPAEQARHR
jgi:glycine/D-amino acid oxidase-like deaminating enzyme